MTVTLFLGFATLAVYLTFKRARSILQSWANRHHYEILEASYCWFWRGPFWWRNTDDQIVYPVRIRDRDT